MAKYSQGSRRIENRRPSCSYFGVAYQGTSGKGGNILHKRQQRKDLHKYAFSTIYYYKMLNMVGNERAKKRIKTISLQQVINETDNITYGDIVTDKNLLHIQYIGVDEMEIYCNVDLPKKTIIMQKKALQYMNFF